MSMLKQYRHRGEIKTIPYSPSSPPPSPELKILLDLSASPRFYEHLQKDHSSVFKQEADAQRKLFSAQEARLQRQIDQLVSRFRDLEARNKVKEARDKVKDREISKLAAKVEARERELDEQLRYEVADRFCRGLVDMLCNKLDKLPDLLSDLASELHRPALRYSTQIPAAIVFYQFSEHVHQLNVSILGDITPRARTILTELDTFMSGPCGDDLRLLIHLWAVRAGLGSTRNLLAHPVPDSAFASEMLHEFISDPEQQALMERILPSLIEDVGVSENIKYFDGAGSRRPDALANNEFLPLGSDPKALRTRPQDIVQQVVTDCSVCASLSIVIDDKLPYHPTLSSLMCMTCRVQEGSDPQRSVIWPSLIEKAYMKLMGGYDFPGSNSCIDLHIFGGWIPEQLDIQSYAVIDVEENDKERVLTVLDPWISPDDDKQETSCTRQFRANFSVTDGAVNEDDEIWVLLTRHLSTSRETSEFIALQVETDDDNIKVCDNSLLSAKGVYTNSTHVLVKSRISKNQPSGTLVILASYDGKSQDVGFTLTVYARSAITVSWDTNVPIPPFTTEIDSSFTQKNAGGNSTFPTYMVNPQYHLQIHPMAHIRSKSKVSLTMHTAKDLPVNITVVWSQGQRVFELAEKDVVSSSGAYSYGLARLSQELGAGDYNVILSTLEPDKTGPYHLKVESTSRFDLTPIPQECVGMYSRVIRGACCSDKSPATARSAFSSSPLNVTIYPADASEYTASHLATSGAYDDAISGVVTPQISLNRGKYWIIPSTFNPGIEAAF
ncbi:uncharacterized protein EV420DRAFT_1677667 [Desarmillaria tabescens]|uniref:Calpain catalytic domain-containing protein n=1 Tax=Armillaria tabescens TaxID=1929756 RepID=A0AA39KGG4_ARMTA|nr:uncharacterized protein EV420DRAFT_1677667 [Desarmillaria tabescens]KAK0459294.1 hypothetical protein EV420DRAFT_1677667 [Desarmillaria tabescens]